MNPDLRPVVQAALDATAKLNAAPPRLALILGSGLGHVADALDHAVRLPMSAIAGHPVSTVPGHEGAYVFGRLSGVPAVVVKGRLHGYEGHPPAVAALPARVVCAMKPRLLVVTNAAGGLNRDFRPGDLMLITDHLNLTGRSPLEGANVDAWGPRFPDMSAVYPVAARNLLRKHGTPLGVELRQGVYAGLNGPQYETPAEIRMLRVLGADAVGMSTVFEAVTASHMGVPVLGVSLISNLAAGLAGHPLSHAEVLAAAEKSGAVLGKLLLAAAPELAG